ncbi:hydrogen peroxide-dependent heme synthase [Nakamurella deserti]|uniref:hydrogen peroxide-dependent heme synthase n=1 Tax=Nakamurella deserti TaxID=2164074 RepID=UPI000DBE243E|nr:hydrogen peroxide-dependent heme synthase [Nakamurella deserti]
MTSTPQAPAAPTGGDAPAAGHAPTRVTARQINEQIRYTGWHVLTRVADLDVSGEEATAELDALVAELAAEDIVVRGFYDVSALRSDADLMIWWHAGTAEALQLATRKLRRTAVGRATTPAWSAVGLHRPAEFNKGHVPAFLAGMEARGWVAVYPFVRSYDWYLLPDQERRSMLVEHGVMGREYDQVLSNTVAAFALGDYEWILALEAVELHDIVDLMRHLRASQARMHVREEVPFFTGRFVDSNGAVEVLR